MDMVTSMMIAADVPTEAVMAMKPSGFFSGVMESESIAPVVDVIPGNQPVSTPVITPLIPGIGPTGYSQSSSCLSITGLRSAWSIVGIPNSPVSIGNRRVPSETSPLLGTIRSMHASPSNPDRINTVAHQAMMLFQAGVDLEELGDQSPDVKWKKNKEKVGMMQQTIYKKALEYYREAEAQGYTPAEARIASLKAKIH